MSKLAWFIMLILSVAVLQVFPKEWNGIIPCVSTRSDAENILGKDRLPSVIGIYRYKTNRVHIYYESRDKGVPKSDIVKKITVYPQKIISLAEYAKTVPDFPSGFIKREMDPKIRVC